LATESSQTAKLVNPTITASIHYCERVASRGERKSLSARSWATMRPATWPEVGAAT
jgi:hypothetical protein